MSQAFQKLDHCHPHVASGVESETISLTSRQGSIDVNIDLAVGRLMEGSPKPETYVLGLNEGGIGLAPFRDFEKAVQAGDLAKIDGLMKDIAAGKITDLP